MAEEIQASSRSCRAHSTMNKTRSQTGCVGTVFNKRKITANGPSGNQPFACAIIPYQQVVLETTATNVMVNFVMRGRAELYNSGYPINLFTSAQALPGTSASVPHQTAQLFKGALMGCAASYDIRSLIANGSRC